MTFTKQKIGQPKSLIPHIVGSIALILISILGIYLVKNINFSSFLPVSATQSETQISYEILDDINPLISDTSVVTPIEKPVIVRKKEEDTINILLVGRGGGQHEAPNLTDTLILARLDTSKRYISFLSIPRDLYVEYTGGKEGKINGIYAKKLAQHGSEKKAMAVLKRKISQITGEKIDYYLNIDFNGFIKTVDAIGGVDITVPQNFVDTQYPDGNWGYRTLIFKKGTWNFDGNNALNYVRSRHSTSDFDRSLRQQQVISALKNKLTAGYFLSSPKKISNLYQIIKENFSTDMGGTTIISLALKISDSNDYKIYSSNINDSCFYGSATCMKGGFLYVPQRDLFGGQSILLVEGSEQGNLNNYKQTKLYTNMVFNIPEIQTENIQIGIFNATGVPNLAGSLYNRVKRFGLHIPAIGSIGNTKEAHSGSTIYYNNIAEDSETLKLLKTFFEGEFIQTSQAKYSKKNAQIELVIGDDYLQDEQIFSF